MSEALPGRIIEFVEFRLTPTGGQSFEQDFAFLRQTFLAFEGGISVRMLREQGDSGRYVLVMEWRDQTAKQRFTTDPAITRWFDALKGYILGHHDRYFDEPFPAAR